MDVDARRWGDASVVDYVPFLGLLYRFYWWRITSGGDSGEWRRAGREELRRSIVPSSVTAAASIAAYDPGYIGYAFVVLFAGLLLYRASTLLSL